MTTLLTYNGSDRRYFEVAVTGKPRNWAPGQSQSISDADAALLMATGLFSTQYSPVSSQVDPVTGVIENRYGSTLRRVAPVISLKGSLPLHASATVAEGAWSADLATAFVVPTNLDKVRLSGGVKADTSTTSYKIKSSTVAVGNLGLGEANGVASACEILTTAGSARFKVYSSGTGTLYYRAFVDGQPLSVGPSALSGTGSRAITISLPADGVLRRIRVECDQGTFWQTVSVDTGYVIAPQDKKSTALFVGDSFYNAGASRSPLQSVAWRAAQMLGFDAILSAVGGTGYVHNGGANYEFAHAKRLADVAMFSGMADLVVISGGTNDGGKTIAEIKTGAETTIRNAISYHPGARIVVTGCWNYNVGTAGKQLEIEQAIRDVVASIGGEKLNFLPVLTDPAGAWSSAANFATLIAADSTHARPEIGEVYYAQKLAQAIADNF